MKKTFTINIAGIIFNIDDDAYEALRKYLDRIRDHFSKQEGGDEVCADIEARIAELLGTRITETKQVVTMEDITEVTGIMGDVGEIGEESDQGTGGPGKTGSETKGQRANRRFYRDPEARVLGGVCGGLGAYFNLDPVIFRIVFIIFLFSGFGIPVYLVLWIITPLAATPSDRLEMRGEPVTIRNIERSVKTEWTQVKGRINGLAVEAKETYRKSTPVLGEMVENLGKALLAVLRLGWNIVRVLLGIIFAIIGLSLIFGLVVGIFGLFGPVYSNGSGVILDLPVVISAMVGNGISLGLLTLSVLVFLGVPSLLIFYSGLRMAFRIPKVPYAGMTAFNIWLVSFIILIYLGFKISNNYRVPQTFAQKDAVIGTNGPDTLYLQLNTALADSLKDTPIAASIDEPVMYVTGKGTVMLKPVLSIVPSDDTLFHLTRNITARGRSQAEALRYARSVKCDYVLRDSLLVIDPVALLPEGEAMQARNVRFRLEVPVGKTVAFDSTVCRIIDPETNPFPVGLCGIKCRMTPEGLEEIRPAGHPGKE